MLKEYRKFILLSTLLLSSAILFSSGRSLNDFLDQLPVKDIKLLETESYFSGIYEVQFRQPIDHSDTAKGFFFQKLYISHYKVSEPVVLVTEGYEANYYHTSEPAGIFRCNQIVAEHRFFGKNTPDSIPWESLTAWQAASDHHRIIETFKKFYKEQWITTGVSKGGQATVYHSYYYPDDADLRIPYVAPINYNIEDKRIYDFLASVGSKSCRRKIKDFQKMALRRQEELLPVFKDFVNRKDYTYSLVGGIEKAFEYCVLEYSFAFWQWGYANCQDIPGNEASAKLIISHLNSVAGFDYFADKFINQYRPFFYQAYTEMGYYGYELDEFKGLLMHVDDGRFLFTLPENIKVEFNDSVTVNVINYLKNDAQDFIFIYGEYDTWSATAVDLDGNRSSRVFYNPRGSHRTRIRSFPGKEQEEIKDLMQYYLEN